MFNVLNRSKNGNSITIRIENNDNIEMNLRDAKLYFEKGEFVPASFSVYHIFENDSFKNIVIQNYKKDKSYFKLSFIVNDLTNKTWYSVKLSLTENTVDIKEQS